MDQKICSSKGEVQTIEVPVIESLLYSISVELSETMYTFLKNACSAKYAKLVDIFLYFLQKITEGNAKLIK